MTSKHKRTEMNGKKDGVDGKRRNERKKGRVDGKRRNERKENKIDGKRRNERKRAEWTENNGMNGKGQGGRKGTKRDNYKFGKGPGLSG